MFPAVLTTLLFACSAVFAARSARLVGVAPANLSRLWLAGGLLALWAHGRGAGLGGGPAALGTFLLSGAVGFGLGDLALFAALPRIGSRLTALLVQCLAVPAAATLEWLWLGTTLTIWQAGCIAVILAGVALAVAPEPGAVFRPGAAAARDPRAWRLGVCFGVVAALGQAVGAVISRRGFALAAAAGVHLDGGTAAYQRILGGLAIMTVGYGVGAVRTRPGSAPALPLAPDRWRRGWPWIVANALAGPTLGVSCYQWALATTPSALVLPIVATTPLVVVPLAFVLEGERPGVRSLLGGALAVAGAVALAIGD